MTEDSTLPEPTSLREALARRGIEPTYWQPEPGCGSRMALPETQRALRRMREPQAPAVPGIEVRFLE
jgi:hypothetical protein